MRNTYRITYAFDTETFVTDTVDAENYTSVIKHVKKLCAKEGKSLDNLVGLSILNLTLKDILGSTN
jgi:hypothetical protein